MLKKIKISLLSAVLMTLVTASCSDADKDIPKENRVDVLPRQEQLQVDITDSSSQIPAVVLNSDWSQSGGLPFRDLGNLAGSTALSEKWSVSVGDTYDGTIDAVAQPIISAGQVFVLNADAEIYALSATDGKVLWTKNLISDDEDDVNPRGGGIAADGGMVFAVTGTGEIIGMNASDGKIKWKIDNRIPISAAPTLSEGVLYITDRDNRLQAIDAESGRVLWDYRALPESVAYPRVASASVLGSVVIAPFTSGEVVAISGTTSKAAWGKNVIGFDVDSQSGKFNTIIANPVIADKRVFVSAPTGTLIALEGATGKIVWDKNIALDATPLSAGDTLYMVDMKGRFISLRKSDGGIFYIKQLPHYEDNDEKTDVIRWSSPLMIDGNIITLSSHGKAYIIQPQTGKILHKYDTPKTWVDVSVSGGILYVLGADGKLYAYGS